MTDSRHRRLLANRYQLIELVGSGAMGQVYRAEDKLLGGVTVAVKFLSQTLLSTKMKERFEREATISALLGERSMHIVKVRDYGIDEKEIPFYVMEFLQGQSLSEIIKVHTIALSRFLILARQICFGLECAHKGIMFQGEICPIVHRDIKPSNILVIQDTGIGDLVKILDFGIAKLMLSSEAQTQSFMGTLAYCSPEQMEGKELDNRSDIYSLGIMMYEMLTGEMPIHPDNSSFGGWYEAHHYSNPIPIRSEFNVPKELTGIILKCLAKSPIDRPQSIGELIQLLEGIENGVKEATPNQAKGANLLQSGKNQEERKEPSSLYEIGLNTVWPKDKPIQKIVFPNLLRTPEKDVISLWVMLEGQDIITRMSSIRYNQFLFLTSPHPMLLWITVLYHREFGPRWLPCYLDLKTPSGQKLTRLLGETGSYWILFFAIEQPSKCKQVMTSTIAPSQCKTLREWANTSQTLKAGKPQITKRILKEELEKLKPKILTKLESIPADNNDTSVKKY